MALPLVLFATGSWPFGDDDPRIGPRTEALAEAAAADSTLNSAASSETTEPDDASTTTSSDASTTTSADESSTTDPSGDSETKKENDGSGGGSGGSGGSTGGSNTGPTITGNACPCTVTGTSTLEGTVNLKGDLMVMGGTLVARSGVKVNGNGYQIMFMNGGKADFQGSPTSTWSGGGSNANLTRDITFDNMRRIMFHQGAGKSTLKWFTISNSGNAGVLGDYPLHFHLNGNSTRGTLVEGVVVVNGQNHAFVPHGSHGITFRNTIAWDVKDTAYWWDPPGTNNCSGKKRGCTTDNSNDTVFDHALAANVVPGAGSDGHRLAGFQMGAGSGNVAKNNAALNIRGGKDCAGYMWPEAANQNSGGNVWTFTNNRSSSTNCHGIFVWQNDERDHVITNFTGDGIDHGAYSNFYTYTNVDVGYMVAIALGYTVKDSSIDVVTTGGHNKIAEGGAIVFDNVAIGEFIVNSGNGDVPGTYILDNTGLKCGDIQYDNAKAGTVVIIDGKEC